MYNNIEIFFGDTRFEWHNQSCDIISCQGCFEREPDKIVTNKYEVKVPISSVCSISCLDYTLDNGHDFYECVHKRD